MDGSVGELRGDAEHVFLLLGRARRMDLEHSRANRNGFRLQRHDSLVLCVVRVLSQSVVPDLERARVSRESHLGVGDLQRFRVYDHDHQREHGQVGKQELPSPPGAAYICRVDCGSTLLHQRWRHSAAVCGGSMLRILAPPRASRRCPRTRGLLCSAASGNSLSAAGGSS